MDLKPVNTGIDLVYAPGMEMAKVGDFSHIGCVSANQTNLPSWTEPVTAAASSREALFAGLLRDIRVRRAAYFQAAYRAPWGVSFGWGRTQIHVVASGGVCWLKFQGEAKPVQLAVGDLVIVPRGDAHTIRDSPSSPTVKFSDLIEANADKEQIIRTGGKGQVTRVLSMNLQFETGNANPLVAVLPSFLHVRLTDDTMRSWLGLAEHFLAVIQTPGAEEILSRLSDMLFIQGVRWYFAKHADTAQFGWLAAARDENVGKALALLHEHPNDRWSIASLAARVGLSRSAFAAKFGELTGESQLRYLTRLRMNTAARSLLSNNEKLAAIAAGAGYDSVTGFVRAFRRHMGMTPGEYRESHRSRGFLRERSPKKYRV